MNTQTENQAFFYIDGIPTKGTWVDLDSINDFDDVRDELIKAKIMTDEYDGDILAADAEGLARHFLGSHDMFDVEAFTICRDHDTYSDEAKAAYMDCFGDWDGDRFDESYQGEFNSDEDFAQQMADDTGAIQENLTWPYTCIDWTHAARELMYDYCESNGHYFWNY